MYSLYEDALEAVLTRKDALREVLRHHADVEEFLAEVGNKEGYTGKEVLDWLGY